MSVDKKVSYDVQGGVKNYLGKQKEVKAPLKWQSSPDHPTTELAYITQAEKDLLVKQDLHGSLKGGVNRGPSGIMSLNGWGSADPGQNVSGAAASAAESGAGMDNADVAASGMSAQDAKDFRSAAINAGAGQRVNPGFFDSRNVISPEELAEAKAYREQDNIQGTVAQKAYDATRGGTFGNFISGGGILGAGIRGLGQMFGLGKKYNEPTYDLSKYSGLGIYEDSINDIIGPVRNPSNINKSRLTPGRVRTLTNAGIPTQQGDYDIYGNKINELTGEVIDPATGEVITVLPGYPEGPDRTYEGGITTIIPEGGDNYTQNIVETINETVDDNIPEENLLLRYLGADSTLNPKAAGVNNIAELRDLQMQRAKNILTT